MPSLVAHPRIILGPPLLLGPYSWSDIRNKVNGKLRTGAYIGEMIFRICGFAALLFFSAMEIHAAAERKRDQ